MRKPLILIIILSFSLTSCIEIVEEIFINKDKSGTIIYRIDTDEAGSFLNNISGLFDLSVEHQVKQEAEKFISKLRSQPGISNIQYNLRSGQSEYFLQFDFSDYKTFNNSLYAMSGNKKSLFTPSYFKIKKNRFKKINFSPWIKRYIEKEEIEYPSPLILEMITFSSIINCPDEIRNTSPSNVMIDKSKLRCTQKTQLNDILNGKANTGIKIRY